MNVRVMAVSLAMMVGVSVTQWGGTVQALRADDQTRGAAAGDTLARSIRKAWDDAKLNIRESADQMPEANYAFKPVDTVRTFGQILAHLAGANYVFCSAAKGEKTPHAEDAFEKTATTRPQIIKALTDSLDLLRHRVCGVRRSAAGRAGRDAVQQLTGLARAGTARQHRSPERTLRESGDLLPHERARAAVVEEIGA